MTTEEHTTHNVKAAQTELVQGTEHYQAVGLLLGDSKYGNVQTLAGKLGVPMSKAWVLIEDLEMLGYVDLSDEGKIRLTDKGVIEYNYLELKKNIPKVVPYKLVAPMSGVYNGHELRLHSMRPGAYDAYNLPSLINGKRVERKA